MMMFYSTRLFGEVEIIVGPGFHSTIQSAINEALSISTDTVAVIKITSGQYSEHLTIDFINSNLLRLRLEPNIVNSQYTIINQSPTNNIIFVNGNINRHLTIIGAVFQDSQTQNPNNFCIKTGSMAELMIKSCVFNSVKMEYFMRMEG